ncbi:unnamed protein product [Brassica oleracea var. botrytis]
MKKPTAVTQDEWVTAALTEDAVVVELLLRLKHAGTVESAANTPLLRWGSRKPRSRLGFGAKEWSFDGISHTVSVLKHLGFLLVSFIFFDVCRILESIDYLFKLQWHLSLEVIGAEGWSAQQGENELDNMEAENDDAASEARQTDPRARQTNPEPDAPSSSNGPRVSNAPQASTVPKPSRKRRAEQAADVMRSSIQSRDEILSHKNHLIESHPDLS